MIIVADGTIAPVRKIQSHVFAAHANPHPIPIVIAAFSAVVMYCGAFFFKNRLQKVWQLLLILS